MYYCVEYICWQKWLGELTLFLGSVDPMHLLTFSGSVNQLAGINRHLWTFTKLVALESRAFLSSVWVTGVSRSCLDPKISCACENHFCLGNMGRSGYVPICSFHHHQHSCATSHNHFKSDLLGAQEWGRREEAACFSTSRTNCISISLYSSLYVALLLLSPFWVKCRVLQNPVLYYTPFGLHS